MKQNNKRRHFKGIIRNSTELVSCINNIGKISRYGIHSSQWVLELSYAFSWWRNRNVWIFFSFILPHFIYKYVHKTLVRRWLNLTLLTKGKGKHVQKCKPVGNFTDLLTIRMPAFIRLILLSKLYKKKVCFVQKNIRK